MTGKEFTHWLILTKLQGSINGIVDSMKLDAKNNVLKYHIKRLTEVVKISEKAMEKLTKN